MSKLPIVLSVVLFASKALSADPKLHSFDDIIAAIDGNAARVELHKNEFLNAINEYASKGFAYNSDVQDSFASQNRESHEPPEVVFDGHIAEIIHSATIKNITGIVQVAEIPIRKMLELAARKYRNFIGDLSYCVVVKEDSDGRLFNKWYEACSYYIKK